MPLSQPCTGCGKRHRIDSRFPTPIVCNCQIPGTKEYKKRMAAEQETKSQEKRIRAQKGLNPVLYPEADVRYCLVQDHDSHWYVIRTDQVAEFEEFANDPGYGEWKGHDFSEDALGGGPSRVTFPSFEIE